MRKQCFKCNVAKSLDDFYTHKQMADGHLNKCIECTKKDVAERTDKLRDDPLWVEKERERGREKYRRLNYRTRPVNKAVRKKALMKYKLKYPERYKAVCVAQKLSKQGFHAHHWSYNEKDYKSIIYLSEQDHNTIHRFLVYDKQTFYFRSVSGIFILDTKEKHEEYIFGILNMEKKLIEELF